MVKRIRTLLEVRQLTPTQFADAIGIARPIVSHILSGRNKPSLEVVQRILAAMPDLSMPWLLNGTGSMQASAFAAPEPIASPLAVKESVATELPVASAPPPVVAPRVRRPAPVPVEAVPSPIAKPITPLTTPGPRRFPASLPMARPVPVAPESVPPAVSATTTGPDLPAQLPPPEPVAPVPTPTPTPPAPAPVVAAASSAATALFAGTEKPIRRIVIFYRDGSFADYQSE